MNLQLYELRNLDPYSKDKIDNFILDQNTNGEFINTIKYLEYHPKNRFYDDSVIIKDAGSGLIMGVMLANKKIDNDETVISHQGTTFAGLIVNKNTKINQVEEMLTLIEAYYKKIYKNMIIKITPSYYCDQPNQELEYLLLKKGFKYDYNALANIIDLFKVKNEEDVFRLYNAKRRNQVRKSIKLNKYIVKTENEIEQSIWLNMNDNLKNKFEAKTTHSYEEIKDLKNRFQNKITPYVCYKEDEIYGAFALVYKYKNVFHTQYLDVNYSLSAEYPNLFLLHTLIRIATEEGYRYFSFGASTEKSGDYLNEGLYNYKKGFGSGSILLPQYRKEF